MIKEISVEKIPKRTSRKLSKRGEFCRKTIADFILSGLRCAEVVGFPDGEIDPKTASAYTACFIGALKTRAFEGADVKVRTRAGRLFLIREK